MPRLIDKATGKPWNFSAEEYQEALASGFYEDASGDTLVLRDPDGNEIEAQKSDVDTLLSQEFTPQTAEQANVSADLARIERQHGGALGQFATAAESFADKATLGLGGIVSDALYGDDYAQDRRERRQANPKTALASDIAGFVAPSILSSGVGAAGALARATPAGAAARLGTNIAAKRGIGAKALGFGVEGSLVGAGSAVSELGLSEDPVTLERAISTVSTAALTGGAVGAGAGVFASAVSKGFAKSKKLVSDIKQAGAKRSERIAEGLEDLDFEGLTAAKEAEKTVLAESVKTAKRKVADEIAPYMQKVEEANPWIVAHGQSKALMTRSKNALRNSHNRPEWLAENPKQALGHLETQATALKKMSDASEAISAKLAKEDLKLVNELSEQIAKTDDAGEVVLAGKVGARYKDHYNVKVPKDGLPVSRAEAIKLRDAMQSGEIAGARSKALAQVDDLIIENKKLREKILASYDESPTPKMLAIDDARDALKAGLAKPKSLAQKFTEGTTFAAVTAATSPLGYVAAPLLGAGAAKKVGELVFGRLAKSGAKAAERSTAALDAFLTIGKKGSSVALKSSIPLSSKILSSHSFAPADAALPSAKVRKFSNDSPLLTSYRQREQEILSQTTLGPSGFEMRPEARHAVSENLSGVRAVSPVIADRIESMIARRVGFLASKLPRKPETIAIQFGPDNWRPSEMALRTFARYVAAVEDPGSVEERLSSGSVTPEDAEAYRTVYPERYEALKRQIIERLPELRGSLPYQRRLALSIFLGVPVDPAMHPKVIRVLQSSFGEEPGTSGGTEPAKAKPQFGSLPKQEPTVAQARSG